ncbi:MAG: ROK family protein, partial [Gemmataceae bacterium]
FPLADWISEVVGLSAVLGNDADVAGLAEALHGAGKGLSPIFYITIGSGIGGGFIINGEIYRGCGRGAAEIGHLRIPIPNNVYPMAIRSLEEVASGWGIEKQAKTSLSYDGSGQAIILRRLRGNRPLSVPLLAEAARQGDPVVTRVFQDAWNALAESLCHVIALLCPRRIVIGGGVSLMGEKLLFEPLRQLVAERVFKPFAGLTDIVPAALGEEVVVHGAIALARQRLGG